MTSNKSAPCRFFALRNRRFLCPPPVDHPTWHSHCQAPSVIDMRDGTLMVFVCGRDVTNRSHIYALTLDVETLAVLNVPSQPALSSGSADAFDANGVGVGTARVEGDAIWLYYAGMRPGDGVPYRNGIGLAISHDRGQSFRRVRETPLVGPAGFGEILGATAPTVTREGAGYKMLYSSFRRWVNVDGKQEPVYTLRGARSPDGMTWEVEDRDIVPFDQEDAGMIRPHEFASTDGPRMIFAERGWRDFRTGEANGYHMVIARPEPDGTWSRTGEPVVLDPAPEPGGWDADMQAYPWLFPHKGKLLVFYNGRDFGRYGLGVAELHEVVHDHG